MNAEGDAPIQESKAARAKSLWPALLVVVVAVAGLAYGVNATKNAREQAREQATTQQALTATLGQMQKQVQQLSDRVATLSVTRQEPAPAQRVRPAAVSGQSRRQPVGQPAQVRRNPDDPRWKKMEGQLAEQAEKLAGTQQQVERTREELEGRLSSTKDELSGSIARTHEEVAALQKRGERDYHEFQLAKSKDFRRVGPVSLSLRKADTKRKRYDLELIVDDIKLQKKNVNLYEPFYINVSDRPQPLEIVVNQIVKNQVQGYVSLPKYTKSELAASATGRSKLQPPEAPR